MTCNTTTIHYNYLHKVRIFAKKNKRALKCKNQTPYKRKTQITATNLSYFWDSHDVTVGIQPTKHQPEETIIHVSK